MDLKTFFEHFDTLAEAPNGIQRLRELILDMAVRGKLVPQDPEDEPAEKLLTSWRQYRKEYFKTNKSSNSEYARMLRKLSEIQKTEKPFDIPPGWTFTHLIDLALLVVDCHNKTAPTIAKGIPLIRTSNIRERKFRLDKLKYVDQETYEFWSRRCFPAPGDIIFTREAPMGEAAIIPEGMKVCLGQRTMLIRLSEKFIDRNFLLLALTEPGLLNRISHNAVGMTVKHLRIKDVEQIVLALPPLAEQKRIVAKVDELMGLCDALEAAQQTRNAQRQNLRASALDALMNAPGDTELETTWAFVRDNWGVMCDRAEDVEGLRQAVLYFSVRGKLVERN